MKRNLQTKFITRQYMLSKDFEIYYYNDYQYNDCQLSNIKSHKHNYYEFYFFLEGDVFIQIEDKIYPLKYGDVVLIPPNVKHNAIINSTKYPYRRFVFWISEEYCNQLLQLSSSYGYLMQYVLISKLYIFHNDIITFNMIQSKVFHLIEEIHSQRFGKEAKISLCVNDLILYLNRIVYEQNNPKSPKEEQSLYENLIYYIEEHLEDDLSLERLANEFYVSKYHIAHTFKKNIGLSIHQYILKKRVSACRNAILNNTEISEAYLLFGFKDYSSFYRAFKKEYGISPKECKNMNKLIFNQ
ncbi:MAG: AraC family transcriptional regulator [Clostridium sp.]|uniref:AraC family transcriptional regulator n=1 Tax=Clostridium sp. TaxID=1506 RepID=UPI00290FB444|nr:AraC family transcriptional regulator [Clostridium sp.]MDU5109903.1 AraC family transcriptional regulator [Clostridium sp.]